MFSCEKAKACELAKYSTPAPHRTFSHLGVTNVGTGLGDHVHPRRVNSSAREGHAERITETGTRLESDRAPHRTVDNGHHVCVGLAQLSDTGRKGAGA